MPSAKPRENETERQMVNTPNIHTRPGHPDFVDLDWETPISEWTHDRLVEMPEGIHRHPVVFVAYSEGVYAIKEMPLHLARHEFEILREMEDITRHVACAVGLVERPWVARDREMSGVVITAFVPHAFPYRELVSGHAFGTQRDALLDAFAGLLVELHLSGFYWGDCSLSNTLYWWDASLIEAIMVDAKTSRLYSRISKGQRLEDLEIMEMNVAGEMADIAVEQGGDLDDADLTLGSDIVARYHSLWKELTTSLIVTAGDHYQIRERIARLNDLGFAIDDINLIPVDDGSHVKIRVKVGGRHHHSQRLRQITGIDASENQARIILSDLNYHEVKFGRMSKTGKAVAAIKWRAAIFEPLMLKIVDDLPDQDALQAYSDFLGFRLEEAKRQMRDIPNSEAYDSWQAAGFPGFKSSAVKATRASQVSLGEG